MGRLPEGNSYCKFCHGLNCPQYICETRKKKWAHAVHVNRTRSRSVGAAARPRWLHWPGSRVRSPKPSPGGPPHRPAATLKTTAGCTGSTGDGGTKPGATQPCQRSRRRSTRILRRPAGKQNARLLMLRIMAPALPARPRLPCGHAVDHARPWLQSR